MSRDVRMSWQAGPQAGLQETAKQEVLAQAYVGDVPILGCSKQVFCVVNGEVGNNLDK